MTKKKVKVTKKVSSTDVSGSQKAKTGTKKVRKTTASGVKPTKSKIRSGSKSTTKQLTFNKENYKWMGIGLAGVLIGMLLMMGGGMPSPDVWDDNIIYNFRRITLAPILIMAGLATVVYGIFK